jgi:hypothetical protein
MDGSNLNEDCEDEESLTRKPVTVGKEDKREGVSLESSKVGCRLADLGEESRE